MNSIKMWIVVDVKDRTNNYVSEHTTEAQARKVATNLNKKETYIRYIVMQRNMNDGMSEI